MMVLLWWWMLLSTCICFLGIFSDAFAIIPTQPSCKIQSSSVLFLASSDQISSNGFDSGGKVSVKVCKTVSFPPGYFQAQNDPLGEASNRVREAWVKYHWEKGGGLPIVIIQNEENNTNDTGEMSSLRNSNGKKRVIAPVLMEETISSFPLVDETSSDDSMSSLDLEYKVTSPGPFFGPDLVDGSHIGRVTFSSSYENSSSGEKNDRGISTTLVWSVEFNTIRLLDLYQKVTEFTIGTAATTVQEAASMPRLLTISTRLPLPIGQDDPSKTARKEWLDFLFSTSGGGLPIPPPIPFGEILSEGGGIARKRRFLVPSIVETAMVEGPSAVDANGTATAYYRLENPGWWTFPFLLHTHLGRARFCHTEGATVDMTWDIEIRPYAFCAPVMEKFVEIAVTTIARNLRTKLETPGAVVEILPGISVPRATWIGGVFEARESDSRSSLEQSLSLLQPWTWGNSGTGRRGEDEILFEWSDKKME